MEDLEIITLFWNRDEQAIEQTQIKYGASLQRLAARMIHEEEAKECVNDTYLAAWNRIPPTRPVHFFAWLAKVCRNLACHRIAWGQADKRSAELVPLLEELDACCGANTTEEALEEQELGRMLNDFLRILPRERRIMFLRRYWLGDRIAEIAERLGCGQSKVKVTLHRTRNDLKAYLTKDGVRV